jgi:hypothetical protein
MKRLMTMAMVLLATGGLAADGGEASLQQLVDAHDWFGLHVAVARGRAPAFYRGIAASAFQDLPGAERYLRAATSSRPNPERLYQAHQALADIYLRSGIYSKGVAEGRATWESRPPSESEKSLMALMANLPDQTVVRRKAASVLYSTWEGGEIAVPVIVNGKHASYALDTDSNMQVVCDSEAVRLGLEEVKGDLAIFGITGTTAPGARMGVARSFLIGNTELRNVAFIILRDDQEPFASLSGDSRGVIGLPVLLAAGTFRWNREKRLDIGFPSQGGAAKGVPLGFNGSEPLAEVEIEGHRLPVALDTGNEKSAGWARLSQEFPELLRNAKRGTEELLGYSGSGSIESMIAPALHWKIGAFEVTERDTPIFIKSIPTADRYYGRLGIDVLQQAQEVTLDFHAMRLTLR